MKAHIALGALAVALASTPPASADTGTFVSSEPLLNDIWSASVRTARDMVARGPLTTDALGRPCAMNLKVVIVDGLVRDRCPYIGDYAVIGKTLPLADSTNAKALRAAILWFASHQHGDGAIPASPFENARLVLFDYNAYWVEALYDYVLRTGDVAAARQVWPHLVRLIDGWYRAHVGPQGLLVNDLGNSDYAYIRRKGATVAYFSAGYVRALRFAVKLARWVGDDDHADAWRGRIAPVAASFAGAFWDAPAGAFRDATDGPVVHPQDGNAFAVLAGLATRAQALSALDFLTANLLRGYGAAIADNDTWDDPPTWGAHASLRVYPFISYFEVVARYRVGLDASALDLIRREWGYMLANGPKSTMWETIGPLGGPPSDNWPSWDSGWSSGAAPALTEFALGVAPTSPGYATFSVRPRITGLAWVRGDVPTPRGTIHVEWALDGQKLTVRVAAKTRATVTVPVVGRTLLDGKELPPQAMQTTVALGPGTHTLVVDGG